jgi:hypothetical protein
VVEDARLTLRIFAFDVAGPGSAIDETLRVGLLPDLVAMDGIRDALVGRRSGEGTHRVVATVWESRVGTAVDERTMLDRTPSIAGDVIAEHLDIADVQFAIREERPEPPRILRVFRGRVQAGMLEPYVEIARAGTLADASSNPGLVVLYLGSTGPDTFVTVSAWSDWDAIELATGGDIRQPVTTKNSAYLEDVEVSHLEILPNADRPSGPLAVATRG